MQSKFITMGLCRAKVRKCPNSTNLTTGADHTPALWVLTLIFDSWHGSTALDDLFVVSKVD